MINTSVSLTSYQTFCHSQGLRFCLVVYVCFQHSCHVQQQKYTGAAKDKEGFPITSILLFFDINFEHCMEM